MTWTDDRWDGPAVAGGWVRSRHPSRMRWEPLVLSVPVPTAWRPVAGQVALIERDDQDGRVTGVVLLARDDAIRVHLGGDRSSLIPGEVVASFIAPDALYRMKATLSLRDGSAGLVELHSHGVERVQRRTASRVAVTLPVVLSNFDEPDPGDRSAFASVSGETVDIGEGGCRVRVLDAFPEGCDPTVTLELPTGRTVVVLAAISQALQLPEGYEYRLVFVSIDPADRAALRQVAAD